MAEESQNSMDVHIEILNLIEQNSHLKRDRKQLREEVASLREELRMTKAELVELQNEHKKLKIARAYGWDERNKRDAADQLSRLIRDVDKCLALLAK